MANDTSRLNFHGVLLNLCNNVYFQPPEGFRMVYPCIVYSRRPRNRFAGNLVYLQSDIYTVSVFDADPDSVISGSVSRLPGCIHDRSYKTNGMNVDVYSVNYNNKSTNGGNLNGNQMGS